MLTGIMLGHVDCGKSVLFEILTAPNDPFKEPNVNSTPRRDCCFEINNNYNHFFTYTNTSKQEEEQRTTIFLHSHPLLKDKNIVLIDSPGHSDFTKTIVRGLQMADVGILVVSASLGEFEAGLSRPYGQTPQLAMLSFAHGIPYIIVAVTKMEYRTVNYAEARYNEIKDEMAKLLKRAGYPEDNIIYIPVSSYRDKANIYERSDNMKWYQGPVLFDAIKTLCNSVVHSYSSLFRMNITSVKSINNKTIVTGRIHSGQLYCGQTVTVAPSDQVAIVRSIEKYRKSVTSAQAGDVVGLHLSNIRIGSIHGGDVLLKDNYRGITYFTARIVVISTINDIEKGYTPIVDIGTAHVACRIEHIIEKGKLNGPLNQDNPHSVCKGEIMRATLVPLRPVFLDRYDSDMVLGRFSVRDSNQTIAIGKIEEIMYAIKKAYKINQAAFCDIVILW